MDVALFGIEQGRAMSRTSSWIRWLPMLWAIIDVGLTRILDSFHLLDREIVVQVAEHFREARRALSDVDPVRVVPELHAFGRRPAERTTALSDGPDGPKLLLA